MKNQQKTKSLKLTDKELNVLLYAINDALDTEEVFQNSLLNELQELQPIKKREETQKKLNESLEWYKILQELREKCNSLTWEN